jgi:quinol monooxygenase YgiN
MNVNGYVVVARWIPREDHEQDVLTILTRLAAASREEAGCRDYRLHHSRDNPREYLLYEVYDDKQAFDAHVASDHFQQLVLNEGIPLLENRERDFYDLLEEAG